MSITSPAVLVITFNRPFLLQEMLKVLKNARVEKLYIACDAPRLGKDSDREKVDQTKKLISEITWAKEVKTLFQEENQGCQLGPFKALDWFFKQEERGIILEDDCLPHPDFFGYCTQLLERYKDDKRIMTISGDCSPLPSEQCFFNCSYGFSRFPLTWGWASWRRAWKTYDLRLENWPWIRETGNLKALYSDEDVYNSLYSLADETFSGKQTHTWDYQWTFNCLFHFGLSVIPSCNLITNKGFGTDSTHTQDENHSRANYPTKSILPLHHPKEVHPWNALDVAILKNSFGVRKKPWWRKTFKRLFPQITKRVHYFHLP